MNPKTDAYMYPPCGVVLDHGTGEPPWLVYGGLCVLGRVAPKTPLPLADMPRLTYGFYSGPTRESIKAELCRRLDSVFDELERQDAERKAGTPSSDPESGSPPTGQDSAVRSKAAERLRTAGRYPGPVPGIRP